MGRGAELYCKTCRKRLYLGYGSYGTWLDDCRSVAEYDARVAAQPELGALKKNVNVRRCLVEHEGHDFDVYSEDYTDIHKGNLYGQFGPMGSDVLLIEGVGDWECIDLYDSDENDPPPPTKPLPESTGNADVDRKLAAWQARQRGKHSTL